MYATSNSSGLFARSPRPDINGLNNKTLRKAIAGSALFNVASEGLVNCGISGFKPQGIHRYWDLKAPRLYESDRLIQKRKFNAYFWHAESRMTRPNELKEAADLEIDLERTADSDPR